MSKKIHSEEGSDGTGIKRRSTETHFLFLCRNRKYAVMGATSVELFLMCQARMGFSVWETGLKKEIRRKIWHKIRKENIYVKKSSQDIL